MDLEPYFHVLTCFSACAAFKYLEVKTKGVGTVRLNLRVFSIRFYWEKCEINNQNGTTVRNEFHKKQK
jgi:hypothetical protein